MEYVPLMEFAAALSAGILVSLWSRFALPRLAKCACCGTAPNAEEPGEDTSAVVASSTSAHF